MGRQLDMPASQSSRKHIAGSVRDHLKGVSQRVIEGAILLPLASTCTHMGMHTHTICAHNTHIRIHTGFLENIKTIWGDS